MTAARGDNDRALAPTDITLRAVTSSDEPLLFEIYAGTRVEEMDLVPWTKDQKHDFLTMQFRAQASDYHDRFPNGEHSIILVDGAEHGRIWIDRNDEEIRLLDVALLPEHRNHGTGRILLERLISEARLTGVPLRHSVYKTNEAARRLYERLGFVVVEDFDLYSLMEWGG